jgi:hypothetical protein
MEKQETHTPHHDEKQKTYALRLDRVWWPSPPTAYKYRGELETQERVGNFRGRTWEIEERTV